MTISTANKAPMEFPVGKLTALEEKISNHRWVVPVLPDQELEVLLDAAIAFAAEGRDVDCPACQQFYRNGLTVSFNKILTDEAVTSWKLSIQQCIRTNCERLVRLCALRLDSPHILNLLAVLFNPNNKFHSFNAGRSSESPPNDVIYARPLDHRNPRGWLVDLINRFGYLQGFEKTAERFVEIAGLKQSPSSEESTITGDINLGESESKTDSAIGSDNNESSDKECPEKETPPGTNKLEENSKDQPNEVGKATSCLVAVWQLIRPFSLCHELLTPFTVNKYLSPILEAIPAVLERLTDEELKSDARGSENRTDTMSCLIRACRNLAAKATQNPNLSKGIEMFRLKMILRLLQMPSFNGKMSALNEVNQVIGSISQQSKPDWLTPATIAHWIRENNVLEIVLRDSLHQQQYVERLEKMLRFMIKEGALTTADLDAIWDAQHGKHEAIVKNVHDLLSKLAWDFTPEQLDHLFDCFKASWSASSKKQSDKLLEVIRRLAEDDKDGVMAHKVLVLFWNLAHSPEISNDVMDVALANHVKILDYSCCQDRDAQKTLWLDKCVEELKNSESWALPALKHMQEICCLYETGRVTQTPAARPAPAPLCRQTVIERLHNQHSLVILVTNSLTSYMEHARNIFKQQPDLDWDTWLPDGRYPHAEQVQERLGFLSFLLKDGQLWLCAEQAKQIWVCLAERGVSPEDREACFQWFSKLMGEEPDLDPGINLHFFKHNILTLDPVLLTYSGIQCFERFFKAVNAKENKLKLRRKGFQLEEADLIGLDYLWRVICECSDEIAICGIELMREVCASPSSRLAAADYHEIFANDCCERLKMAHQVLNTTPSPEEATLCCVRLCRILRVITEYVVECDRRYTVDRQILPLYRAGRGRQCDIIVRFQAGPLQSDDVELYTHSNEILHVLRNTILRRITPNATGIKLELYLNGELIDQCHDAKLLSEITIRHKSILTGKVSTSDIAGQSSNDSSSDSSTGSLSPPPPLPESSLPGVILSQGEWQIPFILDLEQAGCEYNHAPLRDTAYHLTHILPPHRHTVDKLLMAIDNEDHSVLQKLMYELAPPNVAYNVKVLYSMVIPAMEPLSERWHRAQLACVRHTPLFLDAIGNATFLQGGNAPYIRRGGILYVLKLLKLVLTTVGHLLMLIDPDSSLSSSSENRSNTRIAEILREALQVSSGHNCELMVKAIAEKLARTMAEQVLGSDVNQMWRYEPLLMRRLSSQATIRAAATHALTSAHSTVPSSSRYPAHLHSDDIALVREALEVVTVCVALNGGNVVELLHESWFQNLLIQLIIVSPNPQVRVCCAEQLLEMCGWGGGAGAGAALAILLAHASGVARTHASRSHQYFQLLCRLLATAGSQAALPLLPHQVTWLKNARDSIADGTQVDDTLLEGHLSLTKEIFLLASSEVKYEYGSNPKKSINLIKELVCEFLWPCSWAQFQMRRGSTSLTSPTTGTPTGNGMPTAVCITPGAIAAACDLLASLCHRCVPNMSLLVTLLSDMFYNDSNSALTDWEYLPTVGPRSMSGLVGLRNAGATCYMNSVLQQLYMVSSIRDHLLRVQGAVTDPNEDFSGEDHGEFTIAEDTDYNVCILKQVQAIFAHLHYSKLQYYVPRGLWTHFKLQGEPVNLREQQDAVEFFMSLVESLDEALKTLGQEQLMAKTLGGSFSDQKICKGCPHRYCKEEPFSVVSLDIRNMSRLQESLEAYVRGELLEGADAYHCDKCNKKVVTVKRLCLNKLPPVLAIQLKRFEYDFDKVCAMKFNDYFEFPRELDVEPYTVWGLAKAEGDASLLEGSISGSTFPNTKYNLTGIVVHSGQASGGHYYSYILHRDSNSGNARWLKFDDADVSECAMQDDDEMKAQCFGGDYVGEVFDPMSKRVSFRRQKRWWNAYMLFYTREDCLKGYMLENPMSCLTLKDTGVPQAIWECVRRSNIAFSHHQGQFSLEYFNFMKKLCCMRLCVPSTSRVGWDAEQEDLSMLCVQLATKFLFSVGFKTKKTLRGPATEWYDIICQHLRCSPSIRAWFALNGIFQHSQRMCEYLIACPSPEVRVVFMKLMVFLAHFSIQDPPVLTNGVGMQGRASLSDQILSGVAALATTRDPAECKQLPLLFSFFFTYAGLGIHEKCQLIKLNVVYLMVQISIDESIQIANKFQYPDIIKLHQVVSSLVRCCDVSSRCQSSDTSSGVGPQHNPFADPFVVQTQMSRPTLPSLCADILYNKTNYIKKLIEESNGCQDTIRLIQFLAWENPLWSKAALTELLWQIAYAYSNDFRHHIDLLLDILLLEDSWQIYRVQNAIKGEDKEGLFDSIVRPRSHYQKRAYHCVKVLVTVFSRCPATIKVLKEHKEWRQQWHKAIAWLQEELHSPRYCSSGYNYNTWSPPGTLNENSGEFLERSLSTKKTLDRAYQLCPEDEEDEASGSDKETEIATDTNKEKPETKTVKNKTTKDPAPTGSGGGSTDTTATTSSPPTTLFLRAWKDPGEEDATSSDGSVTNENVGAGTSEGSDVDSVSRHNLILNTFYTNFE